VVSWVLFTPQNLLSYTGKWIRTGTGKRYKSNGLFPLKSNGQRMGTGEPLDLSGFPSIRTAAIPRQVSTGIWIGATSAFQQRLAQREQLATELSFLEGMLHGGEADGESSRTFEVFRRVVSSSWELNHEKRLGLGNIQKWVSPAKTFLYPMDVEFPCARQEITRKTEPVLAIALRCCR